MLLQKLRAYFQTSPAVSLLRSPNAPFILDFLIQHFKHGGRITMPYSELRAALLAYRESIQEAYPDALQGKVEAYLSGWCSQETRWLHRILEAGRNEPVYQLTPHTEDALAFLDRVLQQDFGFVGTESRLRLIIETLADLVIGASDDPETRLGHLRSEKLRIEQEIARIEAEGVVTRYQPVQIRERFATAVSLLKQLQGDFRAVEEKFKEITQQVQKRQNEGGHSRGGILEFALDSEDVLKREDQGVSFYEFVRFILSPAQQEKLQTIIMQLNQIAELAEQSDGLETVGRMVPMLLEEARKVMRTNQRLSTTLRRLLDAGAERDRQRVAQLCRDILGLAATMASDLPDDVGIEMETKIGMISPFSRTFWSEPHRFATVDIVEHALDEGRRADAFRLLADMHRLDWRRMREQVRLSVARHGMVTLSRVLEDFPPDAGAVEVLGYVQIAHDDGHIISSDAVEDIVIPSPREPAMTLALQIPLVRFVSIGGASHEDS
jgi:hypothetical protein